MAIEYFCCFHSYRGKLSKLSDEQAGRVFRAALLYSETGALTNLEPLESLAFDFIKYDIDLSKQKYAERCAKNRENIRHRYQLDTVEYDYIPTHTTEYDGYQSKSKSESKSKTYKECDTANKPTKARTRIPSLDEIKEYCQERESTVSAEAFFDFYSANGWTQGRGKPIKDWKAALRTWERRDKENGKRTIPSENKKDGISMPF